MDARNIIVFMFLIITVTGQEDLDLYDVMRAYNGYVSGIECPEVPPLLSFPGVAHKISVIPDVAIKEMFKFKCDNYTSGKINEFLDLNSKFENKYSKIIIDNYKNVNKYKKLGLELTKLLSEKPTSDDETGYIPVLPRIYGTCNTLLTITDDTIRDYFSRNGFPNNPQINNVINFDATDTNRAKRSIWSTIFRAISTTSTKEAFKILTTKLLKKYATLNVVKGLAVKFIPGRTFALIEFPAVIGAASYVRYEVAKSCLPPQDYKNFCTQISYYASRLAFHKQIYDDCFKLFNEYSSP